MAPKSFKLDFYSCKQLLKDSSLILIWFCCVFCFLIVFMKVPSEHSNNVTYCIRWLSNAIVYSSVFKILPGGHVPGPPSIASLLAVVPLPSNCIGRYWQTLADIFKTYLPIGRLFSFSKCNPGTWITRSMGRSTRVLIGKEEYGEGR